MGARDGELRGDVFGRVQYSPDRTAIIVSCGFVRRIVDGISRLLGALYRGCRIRTRRAAAWARPRVECVSGIAADALRVLGVARRGQRIIVCG